MLFDPKWQQQETKADPYALETLITWLEQQPKDKWFCWTLPQSCGLAEYFKDQGCPDYVAKSLTLGTYYTKFGKIMGIGSKWPFSTYGAALQRARAIADQQS